MIRKMTIKDIQAVMEIESLCFTSRWNEEMFQYEIEENEFGYFYVYIVNEQIIGFIDFWITFESCQLANLAIHPMYQMNGYAKKLMNKMIEIARIKKCENIMLEVRVGNHVARKLYEAYGFIALNVRKGYYSDNGEDAIVMCKAI